MKFVLNKDKIEIQDKEKLNSGSVNYYEADVEYDESWEGLTIKAVLVASEEETGRSISVIDNKIYLDNSLDGTYNIGFVGYTIENNTKIYQISTRLLAITFKKGAGQITTQEGTLPTPTQWEIYVAQIQEMIDDLEEQIPTKYSQLTNDNNTVQDANYIHTDNNFSNEYKNKIINLENVIYDTRTKTQTTAISTSSISASTVILDVVIEANQNYTIKIDDPNSILNNNKITLYWLNESGNRTSLGTFTAGVPVTLVSSAKIIGFTGYKASNTVTPPGNIVATITYTTEYSANSLQKRVSNIENNFQVINDNLDGISYISPNLFDPENFEEGTTMNASGTIGSNATYGLTDYIPVTPGQKLWWNCGNARMLCAFYSNKDVYSSAGSNVELTSGSYTVPQNVSYVKITFTLSNIPNNPTINMGTELSGYLPYGNYYIKDDAIITIPKEKITGLSIEQTEALLGSTSVNAISNTLTSGNALSITSAPWFIKKNVGVSAVMKFDSFTSVTIGKGYENYRGRWIKIDNSNITPYYYDGTNTVTGTAIAHGLTISSYLQVTMFMGMDGVCYIVINTTDGTFNTKVDFGYEWNYAPFIFAEQNMNNVKLSYSCADLRCPLWICGDSYMGVADTRVSGQLKNAGYWNYLIDAIAGGRAVDTGTPGKSLYNDLQKMLEFGVPKFLIWELGMNGGTQMNIDFLPTLVELCAEKDIELILYLPPSVPSIDNTSLQNYIKSLNIRYIDGNDAVGANAQGVWYTGMLATDEVHPTSLGAKAIAMRFLSDAPELMQYGILTDTSEKLDVDKVKSSYSTTSGNVYDVTYINTTVGNIETLLSAI